MGDKKKMIPPVAFPIRQSMNISVTELKWFGVYLRLHLTVNFIFNIKASSNNTMLLLFQVSIRLFSHF